MHISTITPSLRDLSLDYATIRSLLSQTLFPRVVPTGDREHDLADLKWLGAMCVKHAPAAMLARALGPRLQAKMFALWRRGDSSHGDYVSDIISDVVAIGSGWSWDPAKGGLLAYVRERARVVAHNRAEILRWRPEQRRERIRLTDSLDEVMGDGNSGTYTRHELIAAPEPAEEDVVEPAYNFGARFAEFGRRGLTNRLARIAAVYPTIFAAHAPAALLAAARERHWSCVYALCERGVSPAPALEWLFGEPYHPAHAKTRQRVIARLRGYLSVGGLVSIPPAA